jgi:hypothetical protein
MPLSAAQIQAIETLAQGIQSNDNFITIANSMISFNRIMLSHDLRITQLYPEMLLSEDLCPRVTSVYNLIYHCITHTMLDTRRVELRSSYDSLPMTPYFATIMSENLHKRLSQRWLAAVRDLNTDMIVRPADAAPIPIIQIFDKVREFLSDHQQHFVKLIIAENKQQLAMPAQPKARARRTTPVSIAEGLPAITQDLNKGLPPRSAMVDTKGSAFRPCRLTHRVPRKEVKNHTNTQHQRGFVAR